MAAVIHCDLFRLVVAFDECEPGTARLLSMASTISKLYEAKKWYLDAGAKTLRRIAQRKACGIQPVEDKLKELESSSELVKIDKYRNVSMTLLHPAS